MDYDVYKSKLIPERYLIVPQNTVLTNLPASVCQEFGNQPLLKTIKAVDVPIAVGLNPKEAMDNINKNGYHIQVSKVIVTEKNG